MTSTAGDPVDPPIVLIPGEGSTDDWWEPEFCRRLAAGSRYVICYDHRVARPTSDRMGDLVADTVDALDALGVDSAHLVGAGIGAAVAQAVALAHPARVATLTLVDAEPLDGTGELADLGTPPLVISDDAPGPVSIDLVPPILRHTAGGWAAQADRLARTSYREGSPTAWFDRLYAEAEVGAVAMPWSRVEPHAILVTWARRRGITGGGACAIVVGCGLGADAEYLSRLGFATTAFDVSPAAIRLARQRFPDSAVDYRQADLLALPEHWSKHFDLVVDVFTVQALPDPPRPAAIAAVANLVAPGGTLVAVASARADDEQVDGPPWPLTRTEVASYADGDLHIVEISQVPDPGQNDAPRWLAEFARPADVQ